MNEVQEILLHEVRANRAAIKDLSDKLEERDMIYQSKIAHLDKEVFSNKVKLSFFIAGVSIFFNVIIAIAIEKIKST